MVVEAKVCWQLWSFTELLSHAFTDLIYDAHSRGRLFDILITVSASVQATLLAWASNHQQLRLFVASTGKITSLDH